MDEEYVPEHILSGGNVAPLEARLADSLMDSKQFRSAFPRSGRFCAAFESRRRS
jgi:hypothetical protein